MVHNGYYASAESFAKLTGIEIKEQITSMSNRQSIQKLILQGRISDAIILTQELYPGVLEKNPNLLFRLKVRQFIEMVCGCDQGNAAENASSGLIMHGVKQYHHNRTPSPNPRELLRKREHRNGDKKELEDISNGRGYVYDTAMDTEIVAEEDGLMDADEMDVDSITGNGNKRSPWLDILVSR